MKPAPPQVLGELNNDNLGGSTTNALSKEIEETVGQKESWGEEASKSLTLGVEFTVGVPEVKSGTIKSSVSNSFTHTYGKEEYGSHSYKMTITCNAPPHTRLICKFMVKKS